MPVLTVLVTACGVAVVGSTQSESLSSALLQPRFDSRDPHTILSTLLGRYWTDDLVLLDRKTGAMTRLNAGPFYYCSIIDPCWSPDGRDVVMSAAEGEGPHRR